MLIELWYAVLGIEIILFIGAYCSVFTPVLKPFYRRYYLSVVYQILLFAVLFWPGVPLNGMVLVITTVLLFGTLLVINTAKDPERS